jgi:hypothetical protein
MGKDFMDEIDTLMQQMIAEAQQPPPPPPDVEMLKVRQKGQEIELKAMGERQKMMQKEKEILLEAQAKRYELQQKDALLLLQKQKADLDAWNQQTMRHMDALRVKLEEMSLVSSTKIETALLSIREFEARINAAESMMEEARLAQDSKLELVQAVKDAAMTKAPDTVAQPPQIINVQPPSMPPINVMVDAKRSSPPVSKRVSVMRDDAGNAIGYDVIDTPSEEGF